MKIQNKHVPALIDFLHTMNLKSGRESLGRTKLKEKLAKQNEILANDQKEIIDEFNGWTDREKGQFRTDNPLQNDVMGELLSQEVEISYNSPFRKYFVQALESYEGELSGQDADAYAILYEVLVEGLEGTQVKEEDK